MAGDVKVAVVSGQLTTSPGGATNLTKSGFGTPKACIVIVTADNSDGSTVAGESRASIGFSDFTNNFCITHQDEDASAKVDCDALKSATKCYYILTTAASADFSGTASTITDGVALTHASGENANNEYATVIMFGGADLTVDLVRASINSSADGTVTPTVTLNDNDDKLIFFIGSDISGEDSTSSGINNSFGVCHATGSDGGGWTFVQRAMGWASDHNATEGAPSAILSTEHILDMIAEDGSEDWALEVTGLSASGSTLTLTTRDAGAGANMEVYLLAIDLDDRSAKVGSVDSPSSGATWTPSVSLGFTPQYVGLGITRLANEDTIQTDSNSGTLGLSSNTGSGEETFHGWFNEDAAATTNTNNIFRSRAIDLRAHDVSSVLYDFQHSSFNSGDWTYTINTTGGTRKWLYWAIEEAGAVSFSGAGDQTLLGFDQAGIGVMQPSGVGASILDVLAQAGVGEQTFSGVGNQTFENWLQSGVGVMQPSGAGASILDVLAQAGVGEQTFSGVGDQTLAFLAQIGAGTHTLNFTSVGDQTLALLAQVGTGVMQPSGVGASILDVLAQAGVGVQIFSGVGDQTLALLAQAGIGVMQPSGVGDQTLENWLQSGTGVARFSGVGNQTLALLAQAGIGVMQPSGVGASILDVLAQAGVGTHTITVTSTGDQTLLNLAQAGVGVMQPSGVGASILDVLAQAGVGVQTFSGVGDQTLALLAQAGIGVMQPSGVGASILDVLAQAGVGVQTFSGVGDQTLALLAQVGIGVMQPSGVGNQTLESWLQSSTGIMQPSSVGAQILGVWAQEGTGLHTIVVTGTGDQTLALLAQAGIGVMQPSGVGTQILENWLQSGTGGQTFLSVGDQTLALLSQAGIGVMQPSGAGGQTLENWLQLGTGGQTFLGVGDQTLSNLTQVGSGDIVFLGVGDQTLAILAQAGVGVMQPSGIGAQILAAWIQAGAGDITLPPPTFIADFIAILKAADVKIGASSSILVVNPSEIIVNLGRDTGV